MKVLGGWHPDADATRRRRGKNPGRLYQVKNKDIAMKWIIATGTAAALLAGVGAANAQTNGRPTIKVISAAR